ncbi:MAG: T9SS type A sorting domain-containing protein [Bacteroidota bacterium]
MKKTTTLLSLLAVGTVVMAQSPRMSLYEEFTGENCGPCAATNPGLDPILAGNANNTVVLKWQVAIPSAPSLMTSLYQQNKTEIDARMNYYAVNSAPSARQDGQSAVVFGATSDHPGYTTAAILNTAAAITSPFTITMNRAWNATFDAITVTGTITASNTYTTTGTNLKFRVVMAERQVDYASAPGSNGETEFHHVARKSFPDLTNGTAMSNTWATAQTQTFSIVCTLPSYIWDKSQVEMIGFIQDESNKKVLQSVLAAPVPLQNDAAATSIANLPAITCATALNPQVVVKNNGTNAITSMTLNPFVNGVANGASVNWTGNLAVGASTTIPLSAITSLTSGSKTFSLNIASTVNSGIDYNLGNNATTTTFAVIGTYVAGSTAESFSVSTFPPTNWILVNSDGNAATWARATSAGSQSTTQSARYPAYAAPPGDSDDLILPPTSLVGFTSAKLTFDVANAPYSATPENDQLQVKVSTDCGATWTTVYDKAGAALNTAPFTTASFVPTTSQWRSESVSLASYAGNATVLVKFVATSDYGNNIYVDQVNLNAGFTGVQNIDENFKSVELFPNPASFETSVGVNLNNQSEVTLSVLNNVGQIVYQTVASLQAGANTLHIDTKAFASGIYNVVVASENGTVVKKLSVVK